MPTTAIRTTRVAPWLARGRPPHGMPPAARRWQARPRRAPARLRRARGGTAPRRPLSFAPRASRAPSPAPDAPRGERERLRCKQARRVYSQMPDQGFPLSDSRLHSPVGGAGAALPARPCRKAGLSPPRVGCVVCVRLFVCVCVCVFGGGEEAGALPAAAKEGRSCAGPKAAAGGWREPGGDQHGRRRPQRRPQWQRAQGGDAWPSSGWGSRISSAGSVGGAWGRGVWGGSRWIATTPRIAHRASVPSCRLRTADADADARCRCRHPCDCS